MQDATSPGIIPSTNSRSNHSASGAKALAGQATKHLDAGDAAGAIAAPISPAIDVAHRAGTSAKRRGPGPEARVDSARHVRQSGVGTRNGASRGVIDGSSIGADGEDEKGEDLNSKGLHRELEGSLSARIVGAHEKSYRG